jgi:hypothetical protein
MKHFFTVFNVLTHVLLIIWQIQQIIYASSVQIPHVFRVVLQADPFVILVILPHYGLILIAFILAHQVIIQSVLIVLFVISHA